MMGMDPMVFAMLAGQLGQAVTANDPNSWQYQMGGMSSQLATQQLRNQQLSGMLNDPSQATVPGVGMGETGVPGGIGGVGPQTQMGTPSTLADYNTAQLQGGGGGMDFNRLMSMAIMGGMGGQSPLTLTPGR